MIKASRPQKVMEVESTENDDVSMEDEAEPEPEPEPEVKPKPRKKREKKVIPLGQNGLKKKRLVKSRMKLDEKGYMGTHSIDYETSC